MAPRERIVVLGLLLVVIAARSVVGKPLNSSSGVVYHHLLQAMARSDRNGILSLATKNGRNALHRSLASGRKARLLDREELGVARPMAQRLLPAVPAWRRLKGNRIAATVRTGYAQFTLTFIWTGGGWKLDGFSTIYG